MKRYIMTDEQLKAIIEDAYGSGQVATMPEPIESFGVVEVPDWATHLVSLPTKLPPGWMESLLEGYGTNIQEIPK